MQNSHIFFLFKKIAIILQILDIFSFFFWVILGPFVCLMGA